MNTYDVTFSGPISFSYHPGYKAVNVDVAGLPSSIFMLDLGNLVECFEWLKANNMLNSIVHLVPTVSFNHKAIAEAESFNSLLQEFSHLASREMILESVRPIPTPTYWATWSFKNRDDAMLFKLACGGTI